jgi:hypothetical protein
VCHLYYQLRVSISIQGPHQSPFRIDPKSYCFHGFPTVWKFEKLRSCFPCPKALIESFVHLLLKSRFYLYPLAHFQASNSHPTPKTQTPCASNSPLPRFSSSLFSPLLSPSTLRSPPSCRKSTRSNPNSTPYPPRATTPPQQAPLAPSWPPTSSPSLQIPTGPPRRPSSGPRRPPTAPRAPLPTTRPLSPTLPQRRLPERTRCWVL